MYISEAIQRSLKDMVVEKEKTATVSNDGGSTEDILTRDGSVTPPVEEDIVVESSSPTLPPLENLAASVDLGAEEEKTEGDGGEDDWNIVVGVGKEGML